MRVLGRGVVSVLAAAFGCLAYIYLTLPDVRPLGETNPATTAFIELRAREARARGEAPRRDHRWVAYGRISPHLKRAVLVAEDSAFWRHSGVDFRQVRESMEINLERREFVRGASTITQQLAKNLYLSPSKTPVRKLRELLIARRLEAELPKQRILEIYLNVIEWGDGVYGAEAAARTYFRKPAAALSAPEAALLAGAIVNPRVLSPARPTARLQARQQLILRRMGAVTPPAAPAGTTPAVDAPAPAVAAPDVGPGLEGVPPELPGSPVVPAPFPRPPGESGTPAHLDTPASHSL